VTSRLNQEKGIEDAIEAVKIANQKLNGRFITIDLYGLLPNAYKEWFEQLIRENSDIAEYKGIVYYNKTVETLRDYFALLFPTYYYGEGFPGNVVDAYNSGLPIIATDWLYNADVIKDGRNGILVPVKDPNAIAEALLKLYGDRRLAMEISLNNLSESRNHHPDKVMAELYAFLDKGTCEAVK
jgi:glycosyltransferase involved in cell wall biosynthesis